MTIIHAMDIYHCRTPDCDEILREFLFAKDEALDKRLFKYVGKHALMRHKAHSATFARFSMLGQDTYSTVLTICKDMEKKGKNKKSLFFIIGGELNF